jgi:hypothetical protein
MTSNEQAINEVGDVIRNALPENASLREVSYFLGLIITCYGLPQNAALAAFHNALQMIEDQSREAAKTNFDQLLTTVFADESTEN